MTLSRNSLLALLLAVALFPADALQLGPLEVRTDFGEPLDAYITLADTARLRARDISLGFYDYRRKNRALQPERVLVLARLRYQILKPSRNKDLVVRLYTEEPLEEARIGFNLRINSRRSGSDSRSYLHILPGTLVAGSDGAIRDRRRDRRTLRNRRDSGWNLGIAAPVRGLYVSSNDYDALWPMAQQLKSGYGISAFQAMLAIFDLNRHAFGQDGSGRKNINFLWGGKELRMPSLDEMRSYDRTSSIVEVAKQNYYSGMELPIHESAIRDLLVITPPDDVGTEPVEPWVEEPVRRAPRVQLPDEPAPVVPAVPPTDDDDLPAAPEEGDGLLLYLLVAGGVLLVVILGVLLRRGGDGGSSGGSGGSAPAGRGDDLANQMALLRAHVDMKDSAGARTIYEKIAANPALSSAGRSAADELMKRLKDSIAGDDNNPAGDDNKA